MVDTLVVHLNRDGPYSIDVAAPEFETTGPFEIVLRNHGSSLHVHLHLDDELARVASISTGNHFIREGGVQRITVRVADGPRPVHGKLEVVTSYGSERQYVDVSIVDPSPESDSVQVDERLSKPPPRVTSDDPEFDVDTLPVIVLAGIALIVAIFAVVIVDGIVVALGALVVLFGLVIAIGILLR